jgi:non-ribosomal peptide synthetase component E (peptide arylation enzyme)
MQSMHLQCHNIAAMRRCPVAMGCAVVVAPSEQLKDVERVAALIQQHSIASTSIVPSMCQALLDACGGKGKLSSLVHLNYGGEAVRPAAVAAMRIAAPHAQLHDAYGGCQ